MDGEQYKDAFTTRTIILWDRGIECLNFPNQFEAEGCLRRWIDSNRVRTIMQDVYKADKANPARVACLGSISITDMGEHEIKGFSCPYEAIGFASVHLNGAKMNEVIAYLLNEELPRFKLMDCHVIIYDGGEFTLKNFRNAYHAIGFLNVMCTGEYTEAMVDYIRTMSSDKFKKLENIDVDEFISVVISRMFGGDE